MSPSDIRLNPAERSLPFRTGPSPAEPGRYLALFGVGLVYAVILTLLVFENRLDPAVAPETVAIPVEIVVEPPPQKKPDSAAPNPEPPPNLEEPASDAPHAANNEKIESKAPDEISKAPAAPPPPTDDVARRTAEANREKSDQQQARADGETPAQSQTQPENPDTFAGYQFPAFEPAPEFDFESLFKQAPVAGGKAASTYLSILYGSIMPHMRSPAGSHANWPRLEGMVVFSVDRRGNLTQRRIVRESGSRDLDAAALEAIAQASPFPLPPKGIPLEFTFTYASD